MITYLKTGKDEHEQAATDADVRATVEAILADIEKRGDLAVRELSEKFDGYAPESYVLDEEEIAATVAKVSADDIADIEFAQAQIQRRKGQL